MVCVPYLEYICDFVNLLDGIVELFPGVGAADAKSSPRHEEWHGWKANYYNCEAPLEALAAKTRDLARMVEHHRHNG